MIDVSLRRPRSEVPGGALDGRESGGAGRVGGVGHVRHPSVNERHGGAATAEGRGDVRSSARSARRGGVRPACGRDGTRARPGTWPWCCIVVVSIIGSPVGQVGRFGFGLDTRTCAASLQWTTLRTFPSRRFLRGTCGLRRRGAMLDRSGDQVRWHRHLVDDERRARVLRGSAATALDGHDHPLDQQLAAPHAVRLGPIERIAQAGRPRDRTCQQIALARAMSNSSSEKNRWVSVPLPSAHRA